MNYFDILLIAAAVFFPYLYFFRVKQLQKKETEGESDIAEL